MSSDNFNICKIPASYADFRICHKHASSSEAIKWAIFLGSNLNWMFYCATTGPVPPGSLSGEEQVGGCGESTRTQPLAKASTYPIDRWKPRSVRRLCQCGRVGGLPPTNLGRGEAASPRATWILTILYGAPQHSGGVFEINGSESDAQTQHSCNCYAMEAHGCPTLAFHTKWLIKQE